MNNLYARALNQHSRGIAALIGGAFPQNAEKTPKTKKPMLFEAALLIALSAALLFGAWAQREGESLAGKLIRLHVIANSDSEYDQATKLKVRDGILELLNPELSGVTSMEEAERVIAAKLPLIAQTAEAITGDAGTRLDVTAELGRESYPTREYDTFSLPAGEYTSLRVTLGEGEGENWWCVVFPPLCSAGAVTDYGASETGEHADASGTGEYAGSSETGEYFGASALTGSDVSLVTGDSGGYIVKFKLLELWGEIKNSLYKITSGGK